MPSDPLVIVQTDAHVCTLTLNRPHAMNAFDRAMLAAFSDACARFRDDPDLWVAIVTGTGDRAYCAGADLNDLIPALMDDPVHGQYQTPPTIMRGQFIPKPLIAAINGVALGGGMECALACDIRVAARTARLGQPEVGLGLLAGWGGTQRLPRLVGEGLARELLLTGEIIDAETARQIGLVNAVVEPAQLMERARQYAARICHNAPLAVQATKEAMERGIGNSVDGGLRVEQLFFDRLAYTDDVREGIAAFREKRTPQFRGT